MLVKMLCLVITKIKLIISSSKVVPWVGETWLWSCNMLVAKVCGRVGWIEQEYVVASHIRD